VKQVFVLRPLPHPSRANCKREIDAALDGYAVTISEPTRTLEQSARMWAMLHEISRQVVWHGKKLGAEDWKIIFTAGLKKLEVVPNLDGTGFVALGQSTSRMSKREMSDLIEMMIAFGADRGVVFADMVAA
jgi:hypothetical protein